MIPDYTKRSSTEANMPGTEARALLPLADWNEPEMEINDDYDQNLASLKQNI